MFDLLTLLVSCATLPMHRISGGHKLNSASVRAYYAKLQPAQPSNTFFPESEAFLIPDLFMSFPDKSAPDRENKKMVC